MCVLLLYCTFVGKICFNIQNVLQKHGICLQCDVPNRSTTSKHLSTFLVANVLSSITPTPNSTSWSSSLSTTRLVQNFLLVWPVWAHAAHRRNFGSCFIPLPLRGPSLLSLLVLRSIYVWRNRSSRNSAIFSARQEPKGRVRDS